MTLAFITGAARVGHGRRPHRVGDLDRDRAQRLVGPVVHRAGARGDRGRDLRGPHVHRRGSRAPRIAGAKARRASPGVPRGLTGCRRDPAAIGALAQASLLLSGLAVYVVRVPRRAVGILAGYGAGALLGAIAFDLIPESEVLDTLEIAAWLLVGAGVFVVADRFVESRFGEGVAGPLGIVVGAIVDGVPESLIFGIQMAAGQGLSPAFLAAVFISNIPRRSPRRWISRSRDGHRHGWAACGPSSLRCAVSPPGSASSWPMPLG